MRGFLLCCITGASVLASAQSPNPFNPQAQPAARADAAISGVIVDETTKQPIADAVVSLGAMVGPREISRAMRHQFSDARGRFVFTGIAAGKGYTIQAAKSGYFDGRYGGSHFLPISVADGEWIRNITVTLRRPGSFSGQVFDERGEPVIGVFVRVLSVVRVAGHDRYAVGPLTTTDDRGMYRVGALAPGRYLAMVPSVQASVPVSASPAAVAGMTPEMEAAARNAGRGIPAAPAMMDFDSITRISLGGFPIPPPPQNGRAFTYPVAFSGGAVLSQAPAVAIESGAERNGVDVRLEPQPAVRISGVVQGPSEALAGLSLRLLVEGGDDLGMGGEAGTALVAPDGSFSFGGVPAGTYTIETSPHISSYTGHRSSLSLFYGARLPSPPGLTGLSTIGGSSNEDAVGFSSTTLRGKTHWARTSLTAGASGADGVVLQLRKTLTIAGRLVGESDPTRPAPSEAPRYVNLESATGAVWLGAPRSVYNRTAPPGEFIIDGVMPGLYHFRGESQGWHITSVTVNGRDHTYTPLDTSTGENFSDVVVTFTNAVQSINGTVTDATGAPVAGATVVTFPVEPAQWTNYGLSPPRIKSARTPSSGEYRLRTLPAGDYYVIALPESQSAAWREPGFFQRARGAAVRVTLTPGETKTVALKVTEVK